jgi:DNA ligase-1
MRAFAQLINELDQTTKTNAKVAALEYYFRTATDADKIWALALFTGRRPKRPINSTLFRTIAQELSGIPPWLFEESYHVVGDLAETIATLVPPATEVNNEMTLAEAIAFLQGLKKLEPDEIAHLLQEKWLSMDMGERFVFNKLVTGGWRIGVSDKLVVKALSNVLEKEPNWLTHKLMGNWDPAKISFEQLLAAETDENQDFSKPYPFYLAYPLEKEIGDLGSPSDWFAEWKWDGIRGQIIKRGNEHYVWSRGEELLTDKFPEYNTLAKALPNGTVLDGEILAFENNLPLPFHQLQTRISRKNITAKALKESPVVFMAYDLLEWEGKDIRETPLSERKVLLQELVKQVNMPELFIASDPVEFTTWEELTEIRAQSRTVNAEGFMLKSKASTYQTGRKKGGWWKWKIDPLTVDAVLIYAQAGHGRRANLYTDFTFAVWDDSGSLVPFAKAYSGLTDKELVEVDAFVKKNTKERFGPVRSVTPQLVMEIAFEGINPSPRHKSGIALRFPRIARWRTDKPIEEADTLQHLKDLLQLYGNKSDSE